jgi:hypothetical protein
VALDRALEALADPDSRDLDLVAGLEDLHGDRVAAIQIARAAELDQVALAVLEPGLLEVAQLGLGELLVFAVFEGQLDRRVAVALGGAYLGDGTGPCFDDGHGDAVAVVVEELGHAELLADDARHATTA